MAGFLLFLVFLTLKLTGVIAWSWIWVTAPLWVGLVVALVLYAIAGLIVSTTATSAAKAMSKTFGKPF